MKCPKCGGENCQYITSTETNSTGFGFLDACCGVILLGPVGILCGLCGREVKSTTKEYWICNSCGSKFNTDKESSLDEFITKRKIYFYPNSLTEPTPEEKEFAIKVQRGYRVYIEGTSLHNFYYSTPAQTNEIYEKLEKKCVNKFQKDVEAIFTILQDKGLLVLRDGLFIGDYWLPKSLWELTLLYKNILFFNGAVFELRSVQEANILFNFFSYLYPEITAERVETLEDAVGKIQGLDNGLRDISANAHFTSNSHYIECVSQLAEEYMSYYLRDNPDCGYNNYLENKKKKYFQRRVLLIAQIPLALILLMTLGVLGLLVSVGIFLISLKVLYSQKWVAKYEKFLEEEPRELLHENEFHFGELDLKKYKNIIADMKKGTSKCKEEVQINEGITGMKRFCRHCGAKLNPNHKFCSVCGEKV